MSILSQVRADVVLTFGTKKAARRAVRALMKCQKHGGVHHFAVIGEGQTVAMSSTGYHCLVEQNVLPFLAPYTMQNEEA